MHRNREARCHLHRRGVADHKRARMLHALTFLHNLASKSFGTPMVK
jgi:hypothetical protein